MKKVNPDWSWIANCPECGELIDQFDDNVEEDGDGDDSVAICNKCGEVFVVSMR